MRNSNFLTAFVAIVTLLFSAGPGHSFSAADNVGFISRVGDTLCEVTGRVETHNSTAFVQFRETEKSESKYAGGIGFGISHNFPQTIITLNNLANCLGTVVENITRLVQNGADGSFNEDTYIGFAFTLKDPAGGLEAGQHEYKVGAGTLKLPPPDATPPTITLGALTATGAGSYTSAITLSEPAAGNVFEQADLTVGNGTVTLAGSGTAFTATITPTADGLVTLNVAAGKFTDAAGN